VVICIIYNREDEEHPSILALKDYLETNNIDFELIHWDKILEEKRPNSKKLIIDIRRDNLYEQKLKRLAEFQSLGYQVFPEYDSYYSSRKDREFLRIQAIEKLVKYIPENIVIQNKDQLKQFLNIVYNSEHHEELMIRSVYGSGNQISYSVTSKKEADDLLKQINNELFPILYQNLLPSSGYELRCYCLKGEILATYVRRNNNNDDQCLLDDFLRNNKFSISSDLLNVIMHVAKDILESMEYNYATIDFLLTTNNRAYFMECNQGLTEMYAATVDNELFEFILEELS
jgi:glutathione synthase/RimK-type ligase-like ATP-grasp enzyme